MSWGRTLRNPAPVDASRSGAEGAMTSAPNNFFMLATFSARSRRHTWGLCDLIHSKTMPQLLFAGMGEIQCGRLV